MNNSEMLIFSGNFILSLYLLLGDNCLKMKKVKVFLTNSYVLLGVY